jgi:ArsR family transcriptional regulator
MNSKQVGKIAKALSDPYRLKIMEAIRRQEDWMQCAAVVEMFDLAQSTVSHHLKQLVDADLLVAIKNGRTAQYQVNKPVFAEYINYLSQFRS